MRLGQKKPPMMCGEQTPRGTGGKKSPADGEDKKDGSRGIDGAHLSWGGGGELVTALVILVTKMVSFVTGLVTLNNI